MNTVRTFAEKRDFIRMTVDCSMSYRAIGAGDNRTGRCINLSAKGVLFSAPETLPLGTELKIKIEPQVKISPPLSATAEVVRVEKAGAGDYRVAAAITAID